MSNMVSALAKKFTLVSMIKLFPLVRFLSTVPKHPYLMRRIALFVSFATLSILAACTEENLEQDQNVLIRVENVSDYDFDRVTVDTSGGKASYGSVSGGSASGYEAFEFAYAYAKVEVNILGSKFTLTPIDYTGETRLTNGSYTYRIDVADVADRSLTLSLKRD